MEIDWHFYLQAIIAVFMITTPPDPVKLLFFNHATADAPEKRTRAALRVTIAFLIILGVSALVGRELLELLGINLNAFGAVGGFIVALMGFEMLYGGGAPTPQGRKRAEAGPEEQDRLIIPLAIPLLAGPGAITTVISISAVEDTGATLLAALIAVAVVAVIVFVSFAFLGDVIGRAKPATMQILQRLGGLVLATIGTQMLLGGLRDFYAS